MGSAQIIAVDLTGSADLDEALSGVPSAVVHPVDDFDEAAELAPVVNAALIVSSAAAARPDPFARVGAAPLLAVFAEGPAPRARIFAKPPDAAEWIAMGPSRDHLRPVIAALLERGPSVVRVDLPENAALRRRLVDIGLTALVKGDDGDTSVQTELHMIGRRAVIRSTAFRAGRIALARRFPLGFAASPVDEAKWLAEEIHRETSALADGRLSPGSA